jgi:AcrR family transcriptional regulator
MSPPPFQRARSGQAKREREQAILTAAVSLASERGIRNVSLTDIAGAVGLHKSAMLRYFETREQIFLTLTALGWCDWSTSLRSTLARMTCDATSAEIAAAFATSLVARPIFCDLLAQAPLNLERNVSPESVRRFKLVTLEEVELICAQLRRLRPELDDADAVDVIAAATGLAGAFWQMATPGPAVAQLYRDDPRLRHAIVDVEPRLARILTPLLGAPSRG